MSVKQKVCKLIDQTSKNITMQLTAMAINNGVYIYLEPSVKSTRLDSGCELNISQIKELLKFLESLVEK